MSLRFVKSKAMEDVRVVTHLGYAKNLDVFLDALLGRRGVLDLDVLSLFRLSLDSFHTLASRYHTRHDMHLLSSPADFLG
jgi:hypothetical protein